MTIAPLLVSLGACLAGPPTPSNVYGDGMVLRRDRPIVVRGTGAIGGHVAVSFAGGSAETRVGPDGRWAATLPPSPASKEGRPLVIRGDGGTVTFSNVVVGDVWIAGGQSNMAMSLRDCSRQLEPIRAIMEGARLPSLRFLRVNASASAVPVADLPARAEWIVCSPETSGAFSAAAFFFARKVADRTGVPIGIVDVSRGGTPIEPYVPRSEFKGRPALARELELGDLRDLDGLKTLEGGVFARDDNWLPGRLFHSRSVQPLLPLAPVGAIWYQGESNCGVGEDPREYRYKMRALISGWREAFGGDDWPFYYVQLPGSGARGRWPYLREEQRLALGSPGVGMIATIDLVGGDIHPPNKFDVGERLAQLALAEANGRRNSTAGAEYASVEFLDGAARVRFANAGRGLMIGSKSGIDPPREEAGAMLRHFELSDRSGRWRTARAEIVADEVLVRSAEVPDPIAVRYAYAVSPGGPWLYDRGGSPVPPFCSHPELLILNEFENQE